MDSGSDLKDVVINMMLRQNLQIVSESMILEVLTHCMKDALFNAAVSVEIQEVCKRQSAILIAIKRHDSQDSAIRRQTLISR